MRHEPAASLPPGDTAWLASLATAAPLLESPEAGPLPAIRRLRLPSLRVWFRRDPQPAPPRRSRCLDLS